MTRRALFQTMSPEARRFYSKVFNNALLNIYAVNHGWFDTLLCETTDPRIFSIWNESLQGMMLRWRIQNSKDDNGHRY
jgi:hypothetical protein